MIALALSSLIDESRVQDSEDPVAGAYEKGYRTHDEARGHQDGQVV
ncbi:MAG: hypothetical protein GY835_14590 [bacterium]|nr:hypothetical protein [bacterium]